MIVREQLKRLGFSDSLIAIIEAGRMFPGFDDLSDIPDVHATECLFRDGRERWFSE